MIDISLSRRRLLAGASATTALGLFGGTSVTQAKAPMLCFFNELKRELKG